MKTLNEGEQIERYILGELGPSSKLVFEAKLLIDRQLRLQVECQRKLMSVVRQYGRRTIKFEVEHIHQALFTDITKQKFQQEVHLIFTKNNIA
jgi:hypothetical protein